MPLFCSQTVLNELVLAVVLNNRKSTTFQVTTVLWQEQQAECSRTET